MSKENPKAGQARGAPLKTAGKNTTTPVPNQTIVALRGELRQLTTDLDAIAAGQAGSTFANGDRARLKARIATLKSILAKLESTGRTKP